MDKKTQDVRVNGAVFHKTTYTPDPEKDDAYRFVAAMMSDVPCLGGCGTVADLLAVEVPDGADPVSYLADRLRADGWLITLEGGLKSYCPQCRKQSSKVKKPWWKRRFPSWATWD